jgi:2,4-dienoyl-CoA reductase-like NADH-dependent reductase (Old Yellow Enzyme family)
MDPLASGTAEMAQVTGPLTALLRPLSVGSLTLRNRFVMPGMQQMRAKDGEPSKYFADWYARRAAGGAGLVISEGAAVDHPSATKSSRILRLEGRYEPQWRECVGAVHRAGSPFLMQLFHEGAVRVEGQGPVPAAPSLSPSGLVVRGKTSGRAASRTELGQIRQAYVEGARLAERCGADGVEVHSAHGYLLHQFLWRETNQRMDEYGGPDIADRARFSREIVEAIRNAVRPDFVVSFRISQFAEADFEAKPIESPEELGQLLSILRAAGVDIFNVSTRRFWSPEWPSADPSLGLAGWVKRLTDAPVIAVGSVGLNRDLYESIFSKDGEAAPDPNGFGRLQEQFDAGHFDLIAVGRGIFADPEWVAKIAAGRAGELISWRKELLAHMFQPE